MHTNSYPQIIYPNNALPKFSSPYIEERKKLALLIWDYCQRKDIPQADKEKFILMSRPKFPLSACFNVHSVCNLECVMCPYSTMSKTHKKRRMDIHAFRLLLDDFYTGGGRIFTFNNFSDIFAHPCAYDYLDIALQYKNKLQLYFVSNAVGLDRELCSFLFSRGFEGPMFLSCHGFSDEAYKRVTRKDYFERTMANILYLLKYHPYPKRVVIRHATDFATSEDIERAMLFWGKKGCSVEFFTTHTFAGASDHKPPLRINGPLAGCAMDCGDAGLPFYQIVVQPEGDVTPCCMDLLGKVKLGNAIEDGVQAAWNSESFLTFIKNLYCGGNVPESSICRLCNVHQLK